MIDNTGLISKINKLGLDNALKQEFSKVLNGFDVALFLTGSSVIEPKSNKFINGSSDVDMLMILKNMTELPKIKTKLLKNNDQHAVSYDVVNLVIPYGKDRNKIHIKCMPLSIYNKLTNFESILINEYRLHSLVKHKPQACFYTASALNPKYVYSYEEKVKGKGYILSQEISLFLEDGKIIIDDWHSKLLLSNLIIDSLGVLKVQKKYKECIISWMDELKPTVKENLITYFHSKHGIRYPAFKELALSDIGQISS
jgi:hypothetical protein